MIEIEDIESVASDLQWFSGPIVRHKDEERYGDYRTASQVRATSEQYHTEIT
jgi:hypothetical protein